MSKCSPRVSFFELEKCNNTELYRRWARHAFKGMPKFDHRIVVTPSQWKLVERKKRRVVVKEVNPLALDWMIGEFNPLVIYLVRHPAAVAASFNSQGWSGSQFSTRFSKETMDRLSERFALSEEASFWEQLGALQAIVQKLTLETLARHKDKVVVSYEEICESPGSMFEKLCLFSGLSWDDQMETLVRGSSRSSQKSYEPGKYDLKRDSRQMIDKWKSILDPEEVHLLKKGYLENAPEYYAEERHWTL